LPEPEALLAGRKNNELLAIAQRQEFEIFIIMDKGMEDQQNLAGGKIAVIILRAKSNRPADLLPLVGSCLVRMRSIKPGQTAWVDETGSLQ
jgi:hypothetical protein